MDAEQFLERLQDDSGFRKAVCAVSSSELATLITSNGFKLDACRLIKALAAHMEKERAETPGWTCTTTGQCVLELF